LFEKICIKCTEWWARDRQNQNKTLDDIYMKISDNPQSFNEKNAPSDEEDSKRSILIRSQKGTDFQAALSRKSSDPAFRKPSIQKGTNPSMSNDPDAKLSNTDPNANSLAQNAS
jgi:hypothetical protein